MAARALPKNTTQSSVYGVQLRRFGLYATVTMFTILILMLFLTPFAYSVVTSVKDKQQITDSAFGTILPVDRVKFEYEGSLYDVYTVPMPDGSVRELALVQPRRQSSSRRIRSQPHVWLICSRSRISPPNAGWGWTSPFSPVT
jgi:ABC-type glycerol-3-phosphate transport system permease component